MAFLCRKSLSPDRVERNGGESQPQEEYQELGRPSGLLRYYTCPLDQVRPALGGIPGIRSTLWPPPLLHLSS
jgi:hypothetical protein